MNWILEPGAFYVMDRGYVDSARSLLRRWAPSLLPAPRPACKSNRLEEGRGEGTGVRSDQTVWN